MTAIAALTAAPPLVRRTRCRHKASLEKRSNELASIWTENAREAGSLAFMARVLTQATLPHSEPDGYSYTRTNGKITLIVSTTPESGGLPYGSLPRLLLAWITTEAVRTKSREVSLGRNVTEFMKHKLGMKLTGGKNGTITRLRDQLKRLMHASFKVLVSDEKVHGISKAWDPIEEGATWWDPNLAGQGQLWESKLVLGQKFFDEIMRSAVPLDWRVLKHLQKSPLKIDIAIWLPYRLFSVEREQFVSWSALRMQFGAEYKEPRQFKAAFTKALAEILRLYPAARVSACDEGLRLFPSPKLIPAD